MFKRSLSRNQRSKGSRVKHSLQVCLLVAVCVWLLYQVKHSHDKKKAMEERNSGILSILEESNAEVLRFSRKDLPHVVETDEKTVTLNDNEVNEDVEEAEPEPEHITEENEGEDDGRVAGEDGIDENDQEEADEFGENGEELENEEEKDGHFTHLDEVRLLSNKEENPKADTQEAREEQYRSDDASSAVVRDGETRTESEGVLGNEEEQMEAIERDVKIRNSTAGTEDASEVDVSLEQDEIRLVNNASMNEASLKVAEQESGSSTNLTTLQSSNQFEQHYNLTLENPSKDGQNKTADVIDAVNDDLHSTNSTMSLNSSHYPSLLKEREITREDGDSNSVEDSDADRERDLSEENEKSDRMDRAEEDQNADQHDFNDSSAKIDTVMDDERDKRNDILTLPELETETKIEDIDAV